MFPLLFKYLTPSICSLVVYNTLYKLNALFQNKNMKNSLFSQLLGLLVVFMRLKIESVSMKFSFPRMHLFLKKEKKMKQFLIIMYLKIILIGSCVPLKNGYLLKLCNSLNYFYLLLTHSVPNCY